MPSFFYACFQYFCICWGYLRIFLAVSFNAYGCRDVWIHAGFLWMVLVQMHLSCEVVDTLHCGDEGTMEWIEGGLCHCKLAWLQLYGGKEFT